MSLDVYLKGAPSQSPGTGTFVRENGERRELTRAEWDARFPGLEPVVARSDTDRAFSLNITHNLGTMAEAAGLYEPLWHPEEVGIITARQLIDPLTRGLDVLRADPTRFREFNPSNGWGSYEGLVAFVEQYLEACRENPEAEVEVSR